MKHILATICLLAATFAHADQLADIKKKGQVVIGVKDSSPPFSTMDVKTRRLTGYDIEFALGIAKRLGVKPIFIPIESDERVPALNSGKVDLVIADFTRTPDREKLVDFSVGYFVTEDRVLGKKDRFKRESDMNGAQLGVTASSSTAKMMKKNHPEATLVLFEDKPEIVAALAKGEIDGAVADGPVLASFRARLPAATRVQYEVSEFPLSLKIIAVGVKKNERELRDAVDAALVDLEKTGEASAIFDRWLGSKSPFDMIRTFTISGRR
ncbi:transporter substrate-binding domain-containing protein [Chitinibacteraceae bacterium HSL-7]